VRAVILSSSEGSVFEFPSNYRFFLCRAQDRLLAPPKDSFHKFFRYLLREGAIIYVREIRRNSTIEFNSPIRLVEIALHL
jgi:hypothetical protein